ncbi:uncharacterized protein LOC144383753 [Gasterosteus aculeatus]
MIGVHCHRTAPAPMLLASTSSLKGLLESGAAKTGEAQRRALADSNACWHSADHAYCTFGLSSEAGSGLSTTSGTGTTLPPAMSFPSRNDTPSTGNRGTTPTRTRPETIDDDRSPSEGLGSRRSSHRLGVTQSGSMGTETPQPPAPSLSACTGVAKARPL